MGKKISSFKNFREVGQTSQKGKFKPKGQSKIAKQVKGGKKGEKGYRTLESEQIDENNSVLLDQINKLDKFYMHDCKDERESESWENAASELFGKLGVNNWSEAVKADEQATDDLLSDWLEKAREQGFHLAESELYEGHEVVKTIEDKDGAERKYEFFKTPMGKIEYQVYDWDSVDGDWSKAGAPSDDIEWLFAEENPEIDAYLKSQKIEPKVSEGKGPYKEKAKNNTYNRKRKIYSFVEFRKTNKDASKGKHAEKGEADLTKKHYGGEKKGDKGIKTIEDTVKITIPKK